MGKFSFLGMLLPLLVASWSSAAPMTNQDASDAGKVLGQQQDALITPQINSTTLSTHIPNATANPTETQFFGGGKADNYTPGDNKRIACDTGAPNPDPYKQQTCNAVNLISKAPSQRPQIEVSRNDPILQREQAVRANASSIVGGAGISNNPNGLGIAGTYSDCTTTTTPDPATSELKTCTDFLQATETTVTNSCQKSVATTQTCHQIMSFTVTQNPPIQAAGCKSSSNYVVINTTPPYTGMNGVNGYICEPLPTCPTGTVSAYPAWANVGTTSAKYINYCEPASSTSCPQGTIYGRVTKGIGVTGPACKTTGANGNFTCPPNYTLSGTSCVPPPTVTETFTDNCASLQAKTQ